MSLHPTLSLLLLLSACQPAQEFVDEDGDGYTTDIDCNDRDATVHPGAEEDCTDQVDSNCSEHSLLDCDEDGFEAEDDCDDENPAIHPGAEEIPNDDIDQDCDGITPCTDLNCDGWPDLFFALKKNDSSFTVDSLVYWGASTGFSVSNSLALPTQAAEYSAAGDLDEDGYIDIAVPMALVADNGILINEVRLFWGSADGPSPGNYTTLTAYYPHMTEIADIDSDGHPDLLVTCHGGHETDEMASRIFWGPLNSESEVKVTTLLTYKAVRSLIADLDGDGEKDVAFSQTTGADDAGVRIFTNNGQRNFTVVDADILQTHPMGMAAGYLDGDEFIDLAVAERVGDVSFIYWGSTLGPSNDNPGTKETDGATDVVIANLNGDEYPDITFTNYHDEATHVHDSYTYWGTENGFSSDHRIGFPTKGAYGLTVSDANLDGHLDIVVANMTDTVNDSQVTDSTVFWGPLKNDGKDFTDRTHLPTSGAAGVLVIGGAP